MIGGHSKNRVIDAIIPKGEPIVPDPQDQIKIWLNERLTEKGHKAQSELAARLSVSIDAVRRMRNRDGSKETRRIEAHHIPIMADYFGSWPPGYPMSETEPDASTSKNKRGQNRKRPTNGTSKSVVNECIEGDVTVIDESINVFGDNAKIDRHAAPTPAAKNLMGELNLAIDQVYRSAGNPLSLADLGAVALEHHALIMSLCENEEEYPYVIEIMKIRLRKMLTSDNGGS